MDLFLATDLDMGTLELRLEGALARIAGHMEAIAMRITDEHIPGIGDIDAVWKAGYLLVANAIEECAVVLENGHAMALEVANIEVVVWKRFISI